MDSFNPRAKNGPEFHIQKEWIKFLEAKGWHVERMAASAFMTGIPDIFMGHKKYGQRWVDFKVYGRYEFTKAQIQTWPIWEEYGIGIYILGAKTKKDCTKSHMIQEYDLLFHPPNMRDYWKDKYDKDPNHIDKLLDELDDSQTK